MTESENSHNATQEDNKCSDNTNKNKLASSAKNNTLQQLSSHIIQDKSTNMDDMSDDTMKGKTKMTNKCLKLRCSMIELSIMTKTDT